MNRNQLQLVSFNIRDEKPPLISIFQKFRDWFNKFLNGREQLGKYKEEENYLTKIDFVENKPENQVIAGFIIENMYPGIKVLEFGCGSGSLYNHLYKLPVQYSGIDTSKKEIETARNRFLNSGRPEFITRDIQDFSTRNTFDIIIINNTLTKNNTANIKLILKKAVSLLKDESSTIIVSLPQSLNSWIVWRKTRQFPLPCLDVTIKNHNTGIVYDIKAFKGMEQ